MVVVKQIEPDSLGARAGFCIGDRILRINGEEVRDLIDVQVNSAEEVICVEIERDKERYEAEIERQSGESLGLVFEDMRLRSCNNKCVFCFIHQMPKGMRRSLYFEDDDFRLSFLHGSESDIDRIIEQGLTPQYISVHATDPELRQVMLGRTKATVDINERLHKLATNGIEMHTQVVLCPGWNDGLHLERTVADLSAYYPAVRSVALVPVGLTDHRHKLAQLDPVTPAKAAEYADAAESWGLQFKARFGERFVYPADEIFLLTSRPVPTASYYDAFPQLENGIGMVCSFLDTWDEASKRLPARIAKAVRIGLLTGRLAERILVPLVTRLNAIENVQIDLLPVDNDFFGHGITVSGLLTGRDMAARARDGIERDLVLLPPNCINGEGLTLDNMTVPQLAAEVGVPLAVGGYDLVESLERFWTDQSVKVQGEGRQLTELGYYIGREK
ncbi:MAG: DUF512 domain-containing protein [Candidatus Latescibacteria bacterium]|nr:DUF512 domain-containing protein [Candidatus Latescibacterota bacterium]